MPPMVPSPTTVPKSPIRVVVLPAMFSSMLWYCFSSCAEGAPCADEMVYLLQKRSALHGAEEQKYSD